ncbi:MAG: autotransporter outer membrane beta-barrel domain-containing protein, partial [Planctomycetota bacterium]
ATGATIYAENFDSIGPAGTSPPANWISGDYTAGNSRQPPTSALNNDLLIVDDGNSTNKGNSFNYGSTGDPDRAIGQLPTTTDCGDRGLQVAIQNNTGNPISAFDLSYTGEQWRDWQGTSSSGHEMIRRYYSTDPGSDFVYMGSALDFVAPQNAGLDAAIDGNLAANRETISGSFAPPAPIAPGQTFYLTWHDWNDNATNDHALAVDDVRISAPVPVNLVGLDLTVTTTSSLEVVTGAAATSELGALELEQGILAIDAGDGGLSFTGTNVPKFSPGGPVADDRVVGFDLMTDVDFGTIHVNSSTATIAKEGPIDWLPQPGDLVDVGNAAIEAREGRVGFVDDPALSIGTASLILNGGEIVLSTSGGPLTVTKPVSVPGGGTLTAAKIGSGVEGPATVTVANLGAATGSLKLQTDHDYTLAIPSAVTADDLEVAGDVEIGGPINAVNLSLTSGALKRTGSGTPAGDVTVTGALNLSGGGDLDMTGSTLTAAGAQINVATGALTFDSPVSAAEATVLGGMVNINDGTTLSVGVMDVQDGTVNTGTGQVLVGNSLTLGPIGYATDMGTFTAAGSDLLAETGITVTEPDSTLSITGQTWTAPKATFQVLFITDHVTSNLEAGESCHIDRLRNRTDYTFTVDLIHDSDAVPSGYEDTYDLIYTTQIIDSGDPDKYRGTTVPVISSEYHMLDNWNWASPDGQDTTGTDLVIADPGHQMAAGLSGTVAVYPSSGAIGYAESGAPGSGADVIATTSGGQAAIFVYDKDATLKDGQPASSTQIFMYFMSESAYTNEGLALVDAAVSYAVGIRPATTLDLTSTNMTVIADAKLDTALPAVLG